MQFKVLLDVRPACCSIQSGMEEEKNPYAFCIVNEVDFANVKKTA